MAKTELLAPAGNFNIGKTALYSGADALYLAYTRFGARAYAKNFNYEEIKEIVKIAHVLGKKIYITMNTLLKDEELNDAYAVCNELYLLGVDALILTDIALYNYCLRNLSEMEAHISTQVGVKDLEDSLFFQEKGAKRVVLARETSLKEIEHIKKNAKIELEVFIHGALCVSYSGGCLMSSLLSGRSGNRGRCAQNCRREYEIYEGKNKIADKGFYLSMKDLNSSNSISALQGLGVDSLKIEGRMKQESYVSIITKHYKKLLQGYEGLDKLVDKIFHRKFTKGFLGNEDRGQVVDFLSPSNEGKKLGEVKSVKGNVIEMRLTKEVKIGDKIRFEGNPNEYLVIDNLEDSNHKKVTKGLGLLKTKVDFKLKDPKFIYSSTDLKVNKELINNNQLGLDCYVTGELGSKLTVTFIFNDRYYVKDSVSNLEKSLNKALDSDSLFTQLNKLNDTPFYLKSFENYLTGDLYLSVKEINEVRRSLIEEIYQDYLPKRTLKEVSVPCLDYRPNNHFELIAKCHTKEQYEALKEMGINTIFYENRSPYVNAKYNLINENEVLVESYGGIRHYKNNHELTSDFSFNVLNHQSCYELMLDGIKHLTLSLELSLKEIKTLSDNFYQEYHFKAPLDLVVYGHQRLMTLKYCPLKHLGLCGKCEKNLYSLKDDFGEFYLTHEKNCFTNVLNGRSTNLIDEIKDLKPYVSRFRFDFTIESKEEVKRVIEEARLVLDNKLDKAFNNNETHAYLKRPIL